MQALLSYDQSPPIGAPFRFFLTAPLFGLLAGVLLLWSGAEIFVSRWTPGALALTHLVTAGFMLQVMLGATLQILPVVCGANMARPMRVAISVHAAITVGALLLGAAFLTFLPSLFTLSALSFVLGVGLFIGSALRALMGVPSTSPTISGLKLALAGLAVTVTLGVLLAASLGGWLDLPLTQLADIHLGWGFVAWGLILLAAVAYVVVPMFQITRSYPVRFTVWFSPAVLGGVIVWTAVELSGIVAGSLGLSAALVAAGSLFAGITLIVQRSSKRARFDASQHCWRVAMASILAASVVWLAAELLPAVGDWPGWPLLCGVLLLAGGFMSVMVGMLYKIVPFLVWLHLQNQGQGRAMAPSMNRIIASRAMNHQVMAQFAADILLLLAVAWPAWFVYPAGLALLLANGWLLRNLLSALSVYRGHQLKIAAVAQ